jgi:iron(III) transport system ATP-binding protein
MDQAYLEIKNLTKEFVSDYQEEKVVAVKDFNLEMKKGEFITLLGPSGCGKTTTLRMIGGFESPTRGDILLDRVKINDIPANKRDTCMVFQSYALFPMNISRMWHGLVENFQGRRSGREWRKFSISLA